MVFGYGLYPRQGTDYTARSRTTFNSHPHGRWEAPDPSPSEPSVHSDEEDRGEDGLEEGDETIKDDEVGDGVEDLVDDEGSKEENNDGEEESESPASARKGTRKAAPRAATAAKGKNAAPQKNAAKKTTPKKATKKTAPKEKNPKQAPPKRSTQGTQTSEPEKRIKTEPGTSPEIHPALTAPAGQQAAAASPGAPKPSTADAATNTAPLLSLAGVTTIMIDGHVLEAPTDPVACFHAVRQQVIASYRAVVARSGTERDLAVAMGTGVLGEGPGEAAVYVRQKRKRAPEGPGGEESRHAKRWRVQVGDGEDGGNIAEGADGAGGRGNLAGVYYITKQ